jgi:hypothetical protein
MEREREREKEGEREREREKGGRETAGATSHKIQFMG